MLGKTGPVLWTLCAIWVAADALTVETTEAVLRAARGKSVTLPCTYSTSVSDRSGFIQWDKLLISQTEKVVTWNFVTKKYIYGNRYESRVRVSNDAELSNASITIDQLTMDDNGTYECSVSLMSDQDVTARSRVRLLVLVPPSKPDCAIEGETVIGNNIQLTCRSAEGSPSPQYSWTSYDAQNQQRPLTQPVSGEPLLLKNISTETAGYYICTSSNEVGTEFCNITVAPRPPSMNIALYAGIAGGVFVALIIIIVIVYCCCCREKDDKAQDMEDAQLNRAAYQAPKKQQIEISSGQEDEDDRRQEEQRSSGRSTPDQPFQ